MTRNSLMDDRSYNEFTKDYRKRFSKSYVESDYRAFKEKAEHFFSLFKDLQEESIVNEQIWDYFKSQKRARIFLGIGCELLLKAIYLKNGYLINRVKDDKNQKKLCEIWRFKISYIEKPKYNLNIPYKISETPKELIEEERTSDYNYFLDHLHDLFPNMNHKEFITFVKKGFFIASLWRNKESHTDASRHIETGTDMIDIHSSLIITYKIFFNEEFKQLLPKKQKIEIKNRRP
jgi:hypothetical protein